MIISKDGPTEYFQLSTQVVDNSIVVEINICRHIYLGGGTISAKYVSAHNVAKTALAEGALHFAELSNITPTTRQQLIEIYNKHSQFQIF